MAETAIQWCSRPRADGTMMPGYTMNPWIGCEKVSSACKFCYAEVQTYARVSKSRGLPLWGADAARHVTSDANWKKPLAWNRLAQSLGEQHLVFTASLSDVFEDRPDLVAPRARLFEQIEQTPNLIRLLLTKRPENMVRLAPPSWAQEWPANVWAGCTVEDQPNADLRIEHLRRVPARVRFLSVEPMLGPTDISRHMWPVHASWPAQYRSPEEAMQAGAAVRYQRQALVSAHARFVDWVICGGESGSKARPFDLGWARSLRDQCAAAEVPYFMKQLGERWAHESGTWHHDSHGGSPDLWPEDLRVRQFPEAP